jgi:UDP-N-acetylmuramate dehydrogenase
MMNIKKNVSLAPYTTFKIGGPAKYFSEANSTKEIAEVCDWAEKRKVPVLALGGGSNVLISDKGFDGLVIKIKNSKLKISAKGGFASGEKNSTIECEAGVPLAKLVSEAAKVGLSGLEWAVGIPGTVGGAINGNSGAFGKSIGEAVETVKAMEKLKIINFGEDDCRFGYRQSIFKRNPSLIIFSAVLRLKKEKPKKIQENIKNFLKERAESNPFGHSAGCFFVNPAWDEAGDKQTLIAKFPELKQFEDKPKISAGFLIENVGLKGKKINGAMVSEKHANFILNTGRAKAKDVLDLADLIKKKIFERYGFNLVEEVVIVS